MADKKSEIDQMKQWASSAPPPDGPVPDGNLADYLGVDRMVAVLMDSKGRAYHINNVDLKGATLARLEQPRTAVNQIMDSLGVQDGPNWSQVRD